MTDTVLASHSDPSVFDREREQHHRHMLSAVAHDLKTPLASIIGSLEVYNVMREKLPPEKQAELIRVALQEAHRLDNFITNILDMARLESGVVKPKPESVEIGALLGNCMARRAGHAPDGALRLHNAPPLKATTDAALLGRAVGLVIDNAIKYGGNPPAIEIEYGRDRTGYIRIHDNGGGVAAGQFDAIFSKYMRFDTKGVRNPAGTGLGLTIARETMRLLQGEITAENHPAGGAIFTLRFPL